ncbi:lysine-rich nucleolar protein 1 [Paroedura picta]|uniref:lysine-rich nucleolar protein 1 n=1 Tax=Paroedura picta TaxID=143630 RepID=UPI00405687EA
MVVKDGKKYNSEDTVQKKNKTKKAIGNPLIVIIEDDDAQFGLSTKAQEGKKKHPVEGNGSSPKKKKKKKKDSKLKNKALVSLPITIQSSLDLESVKETENPTKMLKKKRKQGLSCKQKSSPEIPSQECLVADFLICQKCKNTCGGSDGCCTKRKKKKHKFASSLVPSHAEGDYSKKDLLPTMKTISHELMLSDRKPAVTQDGVSKGESKHFGYLTSTDSRETRNELLEKGTADPTHKLQGENDCKEDHKGVPRISKKRRQVTEQEGKKKWKKKNKLKEEEEVGGLLTSADNQQSHSAVSTETLQKTKSEEKMSQNPKGDSKVHKKKKICAKVADSHTDVLEDNKDAFGWEGTAAAIKRAKKKAKKSKKERGPAARLEDSSKQCDATKRKAKKRKRAEGAEEEPSSKHVKRKKKVKERDDEIQVIAVKKGNCDEVKIDKLRRQALQEEIDRESGKTKAPKEEEEPNHHFGQWSTATFDSAERKRKFLRLMGGFKQGPALAQEPPATVTKHNPALARHGEEKLQQTLQAEFEKAMDRKHRRGPGLGYQPAPQKMGHIDKYASKSVKFDG